MHITHDVFNQYVLEIAFLFLGLVSYVRKRIYLLMCKTFHELQ